MVSKPGPYAVISRFTGELVIKFFSISPIAFWCQCCHLSKILGQSEVSDNKGILTIWKAGCKYWFIFQVVDGVCRVSYGWPSKEFKTVFGISILVFQFIIPFLILIICYGKIVWVLTRRINTDLMKSKFTKDNSETFSYETVNAKTVKQATDTAKDKFSLARRNTIKTLLIVGFCFIICWSQNQVRYLMHNCGYELDFNSTYHQFTVLMVFMNCTVNPFIYLIKYRDYQEALKTFLHCTHNGQDGNLYPVSTSLSNSNSTRFSHTDVIAH